MTWFQMNPGFGTARTASHRTVFKQRSGEYLTPGFKIDGTKSRDAGNTGYVNVLRAGKVMGKITTGGKYRPSIIGVNTAAYADNDTTITVGVATATEIARLKTLGGGGNLSLKFVGPPTAAGTVAETALTVTAVDTTAGTITVGDLNLDKVAGSFIMPADGSETPLSFIPDDGYGVLVTDVNGDSLSTVDFPRFPVTGIVDSSQLIDWPSDTSLQTWLVGKLNAAFGGQFVFDHKY